MSTKLFKTEKERVVCQAIISRIEISTKSIDLTEIIRTHVERRLQFALDRFSERIVRVFVRLVAMNGSHGARNNECHIKVRLFGLKSLMVKEADTDLFTAVDRAAERAGQTVARTLDRSLSEMRGRGQDRSLDEWV